MRKEMRCVGILVFGVWAGNHVWAEWSAPTLVDATMRYRHWATVCTNEVPLKWMWNANAVRATLEIAGMNGTVATNFDGMTSGWLWHVCGTEGPSAEDVHTLTLMFFGADNSVIETLTSRLAVVKGAGSPMAVDAETASRSWTRVKANSVLAYDAKWGESPTNASSATLIIARAGGPVSTNDFADTAGYYGWKLRNNGWGYGTFDLSLSFLGMTNEWTATLLRPSDGTAVSVK